MVNDQIQSNYINFESNIFSSGRFVPHNIVNDLSAIDDQRFDIVLVSCNSLQDFQLLGTGLLPLINDDTVILIESSGYINLEPFLKLQFNTVDTSGLTIASIMNEMDLKQLSDNSFYHHTSYS